MEVEVRPCTCSSAIEQSTHSPIRRALEVLNLSSDFSSLNFHASANQTLSWDRNVETPRHAISNEILYLLKAYSTYGRLAVLYNPIFTILNDNNP